MFAHSWPGTEHTAQEWSALVDLAHRLVATDLAQQLHLEPCLPTPAP